MIQPIRVRSLGLIDYAACLQRMQTYTQSRDQTSQNQIWLLQHPPVFTQGISGQAEHILDAHNISVIQSNRGGQVTYHGPGQLVVYLLLNMRCYQLGVRELVQRIEAAIIAMLADWGIESIARADAPGVYIKQAKIAALGLRVSRGFCYHGLSFNIDMNMQPFKWINPCGYSSLAMTQLSEQLALMPSWLQVEAQLVDKLMQQLDSTACYG